MAVRDWLTGPEVVAELMAFWYFGAALLAGYPAALEGDGVWRWWDGAGWQEFQSHWKSAPTSGKMLSLWW